MTKNELIQRFAEKASIPKVQSEIIVNQFFGSIFEALVKGENVEIRGLGTFHINQYRARKGRNPKTGKIVDVPPKKLPCFRVGKELRHMLNDGKAKSGGDE
jgi:integration host factor subunit beta